MTTKNNQTQHYIHPNHKGQTEKNCPSYQSNLYPGLVRLLLSPTRKRSGCCSYNPGAHTTYFIGFGNGSKLRNIRRIMHMTDEKRQDGMKISRQRHQHRYASLTTD